MNNNTAAIRAVENLQATATSTTYNAWTESAPYVFIENKIQEVAGKLPFWKKWFKKDKKPKVYSVDEFFSLVKNGLQDINYKKAQSYKKEMIKQLKQCNALGQESMITRMNRQLVGIKKEIQIISKLGLTKYVFESDLADLERVGIEGRTVWRKNLKDYEGIIPEDKQKDIIAAKESKLFDNLIVIYTRKKERVIELDKTKKTEKAKVNKVDPICFGEVKETNRLFIIADWIDDECDFDMKKLQKIVTVKSL